MNNTNVNDLLDLAQKLVDADDPTCNVMLDVSLVDKAAQAIWDYVLNNTLSKEDINTAQEMCGKGITKCAPKCDFFGKFKNAE